MHMFGHVTDDNKKLGIAKVRTAERGMLSDGTSPGYCVRIGIDGSGGRDIGEGMYPTRESAETYARAYNRLQFGEGMTASLPSKSSSFDRE